MSLEEHNIHLYNDDAVNLYDEWETPTVIISDGPYGVRGFKGDLKTEDGLDKWYEPHIEAWTRKSTPRTTLWFWCTEQGWATVHPVLLKHGWEFKACHTWDKGMSHVAGNVNTKTISHLPVVSEVCVQYVKKPLFKTKEGTCSMMDWLRYEWKRTGLPWRMANEACGVKDAAVRKYFTNESFLWYMPPTDKFLQIVEYANRYGKQEGRPYFSMDGNKPATEEEWNSLRPIFKCPIGITNVWALSQLKNKERLKVNNKAVHLNQKPLIFIERTIEMSSNKGDVVWDPFGGLFTTAVACINTERRCFSSEIQEEIFSIAKERVECLVEEQQSLLHF